MCGIFCVHKQHGDIASFKPTALALSKSIRHRGPDWSGNATRKSTILCHERLAIVGVDTGAQPLVSQDGTIILAVNGEIYNHQDLKQKLKSPYEFKTHSDCEVIIPLYRDYGKECADMLDGMFSFVLYDETKDTIIAARDPIGITTLYQGSSSKSPETTYFASELKCLHPVCDKIISFPPGHVFDSATKETTPYFKPSWLTTSEIPTKELDLKAIRDTLEEAVHKRLMSEVPYGVLLSGGLDSSLIAAIAARKTVIEQAKQASGDATIASWPQLHSFSIGLPGSPDLLAAREVAQFLKTIHHEHTFTLEEGLDALTDVILHLETFDVTTIRASTPMYLLSRKIKAQGVKMVLSGEGSDEIFGGYLYFADAPDAAEFHKECIGRVKNLYMADNLRANKSTMAWGLEARIPFLDKAFLEVVMNTDPKYKLITKERKEKYILREAFDTPENPYLPHKILWRQKEQFSDGVGYGWIDILRDTAAAQISDEEFAQPTPSDWFLADGTEDRPQTKEAWWYRKMFDQHFPKQCAETVKRWVPKESWGCSADPSGRAQKTHIAQIDV
ncbi:Asparagine synthetase [Taphrina deformans PYCC 5710]|uniref:asparagine synthase (glutamine-hydrolyzing) n=1 Tax=Taphrina deformans (strain PYCC 5710 / ATCC 11124 / CBS 356.35 / IMI 108563 / JCM 9778 / NBRC 8474) TaxID=1097556 RepID=R4XD26_TAPDE|nr:Asparagine synthetase [Taphrina deformans PYCC 5710]|eukprot:CCG83508.1 Asparagine synthetase [Taphrina deformans PYCC 5710]